MATEDIYHVKRVIIDYKHDPSGAEQNCDIKGTYTHLGRAKAAAKNVLFEEGYEQDWFTVFDVHDPNKEWIHGDGIMVYSQAPEGEVFTVGIDTAPNTQGFTGDNEGRVVDELYHVLQTTIYYNLDRSGGKREYLIEGTYRTYEDAKKAALNCLLDPDGDVKKDDFAEYDENTGEEDWPYDEDVMVHAVGVSGENYLVSVVKKL